MHWTVQYLAQLAARKKRATRQIERDSGLAANTIMRWKREDREPHIDALDKALNALGYRIAIVPIERDPFNAKKRNKAARSNNSQDIRLDR